MGRFTSTQGAKHFEKSTPIWEARQDTVEVIDLDKEPEIQLVRTKHGHALRDDDSNYIYLKRDVLATKSSYRIATFDAVSDWSNDEGELMIKKGSVKAFAF